jgi:hypothetical protein
MQPVTRPGLLAALAAAMIIASCAGGAGSPAGDLGGSSGDASEAAPAAASAGTWTVPESALTDGSLPSIPLEESTELSRSSSDAGSPPAGGSVSVLGKDFIQSWNATVEGDSLSLVPVDVLGGEHAVAFGLYKVSGLNGMRPTLLNVECLPGGLGQQYAVGVADYFRGRWDWFGPSSLPELQCDIRGRAGRHVSAGGNMYFVVVCFDENTAVFSRATLQFEPAGGDVPPGCPLQLRASDGLTGHILVDWMPGQGNLSFELFRAPGPKEPGVRPDWAKIADLTDNHYDDQEVEPLKPYLYRVRATNEAGESVFTNPDHGFAGGEGGLDGRISGVVTLRGSGEFVHGVTVALLGAPGAGPLLRKTNEQGVFSFEHLPAGHYIVVPQSPLLDFEPRFATVGLNNEHPVAELSFEAHFDFAAHVLWGFAYTMGGPDNPGLHPLADTEISVRRLDSGESITIKTGEAGFWSLGQQPVGAYKVSAAKAGFAFNPPARDAFIDGEHMTPALVFFGMPAGTPPPDGDPAGEPQ